jgi:DNA polymerase (family X)
VTNKEIAKKFQQLAQLMEFWDENPFKIKSYNSAYILLRKIDAPLDIMTDAEIASLKGVGTSIAKGIRELLQTGNMSAMEPLRAKTPEGVQAMLRISGYGPKKIKQLWQELGVESLGELLYACEENRLVNIKGFGEKTQSDLKQKILYLQQAEGKMLYANAERVANHSANELRRAAPHIYIKVSGELRRRCPVVELIQFVVIEQTARLVELIAEKRL